eukprot:7305433-Prymnesium_polylepis.1
MHGTQSEGIRGGIYTALLSACRWVVLKNTRVCLERHKGHGGRGGRGRAGGCWQSGWHSGWRGGRLGGGGW